ncbi:unnamed protein product [Staurois parvus]|uniref:Uncharacterized protein n=1 Tax=Staurois parvus TaxID=386267 RepID=A0ABN9AVJ0_9NEOB|nr:unnamed protein product [Staurois parvus]
MAGRWQCRGALTFINGACHFGLCALPGSVWHRYPWNNDSCVRSRSCDN